MRREIKNIVIVLLSVFISMIMTACSDRVGSGDEPAFTASDMEGNWSLHAISFGLGGMEDGNVRGSIEMDSAGAVTSGSFVGSDGQAAPLTSGALAINDAGEVDGTIVAAEQFNIAVNSGKIDPSKSIMVWTDTSVDLGSIDMGAAIKQGGTFATSDLEGKWHLFGPSVNGAAIAGEPEGTIWGSFELDANGSFVGGNISTSDEMNLSVSGGSYVMNSAGDLNGTFTVSFAGQDFNATVDSGKMDPSKEIMFMVNQTAFGSNELIAAVKSGGTFATSDLEGKWYLYGVSTGSEAGKLAIIGSVEQDASGNAKSGSFSYRGELTGLESVDVPITSGTVALNENGELSGSFVANEDDEESTITVVSGKMALSKNIIIWVAKTTENDNVFLISIKGN